MKKPVLSIDEPEGTFNQGQVFERKFLERRNSQSDLLQNFDDSAKIRNDFADRFLLANNEH